MMQVYFLGTGTSQGVPVIGCHQGVCTSTDSKDKRLRVSVWITWDDYSIVIDCGPDFRAQMLQSGCPKLDAILFTHEHADHTAGLDDIRPFFFRQSQAIPVYAHTRVLDNLAKRYDYIFETENKYPGAPSVHPIPVVQNEPFEIGSTTIIPINASHANLQVFGYRIRDFVYLTDVKTMALEEYEKMRGVKVLVVNALHEESHHSHFNLQEALDFIHLIQPEKAFLTHISHHMGYHEEVSKRLPENVYLAYDNLILSL
jgi:phosphoribosyl 1,2-cyclic phosphate phosphodiesterase